MPAPPMRVFPLLNKAAQDEDHKGLAVILADISSAAWRKWRRRAPVRPELVSLSAGDLRDCGIPFSLGRSEAMRRFWQPCVAPRDPLRISGLTDFSRAVRGSGRHNSPCSLQP